MNISAFNIKKINYDIRMLIFHTLFFKSIL